MEKIFVEVIEPDNHRRICVYGDGFSPSDAIGSSNQSSSVQVQ